MFPESAKLSLRGSVFEDQINLKEFDAVGPGGFEVRMKGMWDGTEDRDIVSADLSMKNVPSVSFLRHFKHRFDLDANVNSNLRLRGTGTNPELSCDFSIPNGKLNDKLVRNLRGSFSYK